MTERSEVRGALFAVFALRSFSEGGPGTNLIEHYACRGTSLIGASKLSRYRIFVGGTCAVSRYKLSRTQKLITVQDFNCVQMREPALSGAKGPGARTITKLS